MTWRLARSLWLLREQVDDHAPARARTSDGTIGDAAHASRDSDHNPWVKDSDGVGVVTALDLTHDPRGGLDVGALAAAIVRSRDPRVKYLIFERQILSSTRQPWTWRPYTGLNPHLTHLHVSVHPHARYYHNQARWAMPHTPTPPEHPEDTMTPTQLATVLAEIRRVGDHVWRHELPNPLSATGDTIPAWRLAAQVLGATGGVLTDPQIRQIAAQIATELNGTLPDAVIAELKERL